MPEYSIVIAETITTKSVVIVPAKNIKDATAQVLKKNEDEFIRLIRDYEQERKTVERQVISIKKNPSKKELKIARKKYSDKLNEIDTRISDFINKQLPGSEIYVTFSAYEEDDAGLPLVETLDKIPINGNIVVFSEKYVSGLMLNPTWLELCYVANQQIQITNDYHHIFLESIEQVKKVPKWLKKLHSGKNIKFCELCMGS